MTRVATWNLHHMAKQRRIPAGVVDVIESESPDVLVLTEYVDRGKRAGFEAELSRIGYSAIHVTAPPRAPQNQILMASRLEQAGGHVSSPDIAADDEAPRTNFLHRWLPTLDLHVVGFRAPYYQPKEPHKLPPYWAHLKSGALELQHKRTVYIGDFNVGSMSVDAAGAAALQELQAVGYQLLPETQSADRAMVSATVTLRSWRFVEESAGHRLTGKGGLSDHSMLVVEVE